MYYIIIVKRILKCIVSKDKHCNYNFNILYIITNQILMNLNITRNLILRIIYGYKKVYFER